MRLAYRRHDLNLDVPQFRDLQHVLDELPRDLNPAGPPPEQMLLQDEGKRRVRPLPQQLLPFRPRYPLRLDLLVTQRRQLVREQGPRVRLRLQQPWNQWPNLRSLTVEGCSRDPAWVLRAALRAPRLTRIALAVESLGSLTDLTPLPRIERLMITGLRDRADTGLLSRVFPRLGRLALGLVGGAMPIDLRGLHDLPGLRVDLWGDVPEEADIAGAEAFGDRLRTRQGVIY